MLGGDFESKSSTAKHFMDFNDDNLINNENGNFYLTMTIDLKNDTVSLCSLGSCVGRNKCNEGYLDSSMICNSSIPFTIGVIVSGSPMVIQYSNFLLYGCRLYDRVLSDEEIKLNYNESKSLLEN